MRFEDLKYLQMLWLVPLLALVAWFGLRQAQKKVETAFGTRIAPLLSASVSTIKRKAKIFLQAIVLVMFIFALARPQGGQRKEEVKSAGVEMMLLADVSNSMLADDLRPNRLEQAKTDMGKLVDQLAGHKIGVVAFAGTAALLSPLTADPSSLRLFIDSLSVSSVSSQGTNFKDALEEAKAAFNRGGVESDATNKVTRVMIIFSDGEDHEPGANALIESLVKSGVRIFTVAYGTEKGAPIPERDSLGFLRGYKKDPSGNTILTTVKGEALQSMAKMGEGSFNFAQTDGSHIKNLIEDINILRKTEFETAMAVQYEEKFQLPLFLGFLLGLIELVMGERRRQFRMWRGRFEVPSS